MVVEDPGDVAGRHARGAGDLEGHGDAALHVAGAAAVDAVVGDPTGEIPGDRDGVEVTGDDDALGAAQMRPGDDGVTEAVDAEVGLGAKDVFDLVGERGFVAADALDVDHRAQQGDKVGAHIQRHASEPSRGSHRRGGPQAQAMQRRAVGRARRRSSGIGCPQVSQTP